jgi:di/tricarboxylate transporter
VVLAVSRSGRRIHQRIGDIVLQPGDSLFLETTPSFVEQQRNTSDFFLVSKLDNGGPPTREQTWIAFGILVGMVVLAAIGILSMLQAALVAASLMLITRCCSEEAARRSIDLPLLLAIVGSFGLGRALELSGAASMISGVLLDVAGTNPGVALAAIYAITSVVTSLVTNNAAAVIMFPIAVSTADGLGVSHIPFVISLMISASADFATPVGYQTNLMVYAAGGYRFFDFFRIGFPITLALWVATVLVAPIMWPF